MNFNLNNMALFILFACFFIIMTFFSLIIILIFWIGDSGIREEIKSLDKVSN
jgi:uncharacterized SAM-binding protein YcdF (DUF218 family)